MTNEELFFDLVYAFALTQLSHQLWHHLTGIGIVQTLILWFAVWLGWQYTCWVTNWFNPEAPAIRSLLLITMALALVMAASIPDAFAARARLFALAYTLMQVGRTAYIVVCLPAEHALAANYRRILAWLLIAACFWLAGAWAPAGWRVGLWLTAVGCEYVSPMFGFALPGLGRSHSRDWTIEGGHLAERCQQFVIVALGESLLVTGAALGRTAAPAAGEILGAGLAFLGTLAMWWLYFGTSTRAATEAIMHADDPGRMGASLHYVHAILIGGIVVAAVGNDLVLARPFAIKAAWEAGVLAAGPCLYLLGSALYKRIVYGVVPRSHLLGACALMLCVPLTQRAGLLLPAALGTAMLLAVSLWEMRLGRCPVAVPRAH